jgi:acetoin utilization deacetylase AcuC-like enzyme
VGYNINICWNLPEKKPNSAYERDESVGDDEYEAAFSRIIIPILKQYAADLILVSCGFDSGDGDTIGNLKISKNGYKIMTQQLKSLGKPILAVL